MTTFEQQLKDTLSQTYDIERELGGGGMSRVFVAIDRSLGRKVVIKLLSPELIADVNRGRFRREIQVAAQLQHPHIVPLLSAGEHGDLVWYTMPFIAGESLRSAVEKNGAMSVSDVVRVLYHVGEALDYAHGEGVVHRDIKAANILRSGNYALVTDFGVAKALNAAMPASGMTSTGMAIGTPAYMAPEQLAGDPKADHRIDIYAVGLLAYELLNGKSPFAATTPAKVLAAVLMQDPEPLIDVRPDVPRSLSEVVMSCLSKEPDERPASARKLLNALDMFSTASGEIRTTEHKILLESSTRTAAHPMPARVETRVETTAEPTPANQMPAVEPDQSQRNGKKMLVGGLALLVPIIAGAIILSQRSSNKSSANTASPTGIPPVTQSAPVQPQPAAVQPQPGAVPQKVVAAPKLDSQAIADSVKKARADAAKRAAASKDSLRADSAKRAAAKRDTLSKAIRIRARAAASGLLANPGARKSFADGATHKGGLLGSKRTGDLQTQIDALQPFLKGSGLTYEQFKDIVKASGITLFDEFGRMVPDSLKRFVSETR